MDYIHRLGFQGCISQVIFDESFLVHFKICKRRYAKNIFYFYFYFYFFYVTNGMASILKNCYVFIKIFIDIYVSSFRKSSLG